jgi:hypothetical protein
MANPVMFIRMGDTYFNADEITQIVLQSDGTAHMTYGGGDDYIVLHLAGDKATATSTLNTLLAPVDLTPYT